MFPKLRRKGSKPHHNGNESVGSDVFNGDNDRSQSDFVFRILYNTSRTLEQSKQVFEVERNSVQKCFIP